MFRVVSSLQFTFLVLISRSLHEGTDVCVSELEQRAEDNPVHCKNNDCIASIEDSVLSYVNIEHIRHQRMYHKKLQNTNSRDTCISGEYVTGLHLLQKKAGRVAEDGWLCGQVTY
jgi:hypothetical protein